MTSKKKKKKKKLLLDVILFHTYMRNFDLDLLALLFYYFPLVLLNLVLVIPLEIVEKEPKISILV